MSSLAIPTDRRGIYYWKCDRAAAFHGTAENADSRAVTEPLAAAIGEAFPGKPVSISPAGGQGNHLTFLARIGGDEFFVRVEDGPERDDYLEVESHVLGEVARVGVPAPRVLAVDATRTHVPFAWQVLEKIPHPDLNQLHKQGRLSPAWAAKEIGAAVARWQGIEPHGFGPFSTAELRRSRNLSGFHASYEDYFFLNLETHLEFLVDRAFLAPEQADELSREITGHKSLLTLERGCLVHKDLALWNILGTETQIAAFIDWDDAISGDPLDDLSSLGCFYDGSVIARALEGYAGLRPLPDEHRRRFWLHLLRNMIVKAVIRVGAGYFQRTSGFFLIGAGSSGADLRAFTQARLAAALRGLRDDLEPASL